jgi:hypothetical protein
MDVQKLLGSPYLFVISYLLYSGLGIAWFHLVSEQFSINPVTFFFMGAGLGAFVLGSRITLPDMRMGYFVLIGLIVAFYSIQEYGIVGLIIPVGGLCALAFIEKIPGKWLFLFGCVLLVIQLIIGGIPLLNTVLRKATVTPLFVFGYCFLFLGITFMIRTFPLRQVTLATLFSLGLLSVFTFRVYILELMIAVLLSLYLYKKIRISQIVLIAFPLFILLIVVGHIGVLYQEWRLNPLELFMYRPAFTFGVLNEIVHEAGIWGIGHGQIWLHFSSATYIGSFLFGYDCNITSTIMGPLIFDGGIIELILCMTFFGSALYTIYKKTVKNQLYVPYYAICMAMVLVGVDVSFIPSIIVLFLVGLYLVSNPVHEKGRSLLK